MQEPETHSLQICDTIALESLRFMLDHWPVCLDCSTDFQVFLDQCVGETVLYVFSQLLQRESWLYCLICVLVDMNWTFARYVLYVLMHDNDCLLNSTIFTETHSYEIRSFQQWNYKKVPVLRWTIIEAKFLTLFHWVTALHSASFYYKHMQIERFHSTYCKVTLIHTPERFQQQLA